MLAYDTDMLLRALAPLSRAAGTAFSAACAEHLMPALRRSPGPLVHGDLQLLEDALAEVWAFADGVRSTTRRTAAALVALLPGEESEDWEDSWAICENAVAAVVYAVRSADEGELRLGEWAARQSYDAADWRAQQLLDSAELNGPGSERFLLSRPVTQMALRGICDNLLEVTSSPDGPWAGLRRRAHGRGTELAEALLPC